MTDYVTNPARAALALASGAVVGAASWAFVFIMWNVADLALMAPVGVVVGIVALIVYVLGLGLLGVPLWLILHQIGCRRPLNAVALGGVLNALPSLLGLLGGPIEFRAFTSVALAAAIGAVVGWVIWRVAYRRAA